MVTRHRTPPPSIEKTQKTKTQKYNTKTTEVEIRTAINQSHKV